MFNNFLKSLSILKKFLFINLIIFLVIGLLTLIYIRNVKPNLILKKTVNHINIIYNTIEHISRLDVKNGVLVKGINLEGLRNLGDPNYFAKKIL